MILCGGGWSVLGLRVIPKHKLAPPLHNLSRQREKQRATSAGLRFRRWFFNEKEIPKYILALRFSSPSAIIVMTIVIAVTISVTVIATTTMIVTVVVIISDHRERAFWGTHKVSCRPYEFGLFLAALTWFFLIIILCIPCTFAQWARSTLSRDRAYRQQLHRGIFDTLAFSKCARVQSVHKVITEKC